jgi:hypothetical protein
LISNAQANSNIGAGGAISVQFGPSLPVLELNRQVAVSGAQAAALASLLYVEWTESGRISSMRLEIVELGC